MWCWCDVDATCSACVCCPQAWTSAKQEKQDEFWDIMSSMASKKVDWHERCKKTVKFSLTLPAWFE